MHCLKKIVTKCHVFINKAVVGSGSVGAPNYMGEGVAYGKIPGISHYFFTLCMWHAPWCLMSGCISPPYATLWPYVQLWHHIWTHMTSSMMSSLHHWHVLAKPIKGIAQYLSGIILVPLSSDEVLIHTGIDVLMHPHFWSLLHSKIIDWVVICYCHECPHYVDTFTHSRSILWALLFSLLVTFCRTSVPSVGACVHCIHHADKS